jgi:hypothetical protein
MNMTQLFLIKKVDKKDNLYSPQFKKLLICCIRAIHNSRFTADPNSAADSPFPHLTRNRPLTGNIQLKDTARRRTVFTKQVAPNPFRRPLCTRQPQSISVQAFACIHSFERFEYRREINLLDPDAIIGHNGRDHPFRLLHRNTDQGDFRMIYFTPLSIRLCMMIEKSIRFVRTHIGPPGIPILQCINFTSILFLISSSSSIMSKTLYSTSIWMMRL